MTGDTAGQYANSAKLAARARLNRDYTIAQTPWFVWVAKQLALQAGDAVLDVGCGPGWFWAEAAGSLPPGLTLTLVDSSAGMVDEAVKRCRELPFASVEGRVADGASLPFEEGRFDAVIAMHMLYHLPDPEAGVAQMMRVLKPGGLLAVTTNGPGNKHEIHELSHVFGGAASDPAASLFGTEKAQEAMRAHFGNVTLMRYPARMRVTSPEDVFLALTSYPPGDGASQTQLAAFREALAKAFRAGDGALEVRLETGLLLSRKP